MSQGLVEILSRSPEETRRIGRRLARVLGDNDVVFLVGPLGAGKTVVAKGIAEGLAVAEGRSVLSPTYTLIRSYRGTRALHHVDLYRISAPSDAGEILAMVPDGIVVVEWPDRCEEFLPEPTWRIEISFSGEHRRVAIQGPAILLSSLRP